MRNYNKNKNPLTVLMQGYPGRYLECSRKAPGGLTTTRCNMRKSTFSAWAKSPYLSFQANDLHIAPRKMPLSAICDLAAMCYRHTAALCKEHPWQELQSSQLQRNKWYTLRICCICSHACMYKHLLLHQNTMAGEYTAWLWMSFL